MGSRMLIAARSHASQGKRCTHEPSRKAIHLLHIVQGIATHVLRVVSIGLKHFRAFQVLWTTWTCKEQWHLEQRSTFLHERQIETQEIMVFDDIGIAFTDERTEVGDELCLPIGRRGLKDGRETPVIANSYKKDAATFGV